MKIKKFISVILAIIMSFGICAFASAQEISEGYTPIYTAEDLNNIRNDLDGKYILMNDIDLSVYENWEPIGTSDEPFTGEFDGDGYNISHLTINDTQTEDMVYYYALFGYVKNSKFNSITLTECNILAKHRGETRGYGVIGAIVGYCYGTEISGCTVFGKVTADGFGECFAGGLTGRCKASKISCCSNYAEVTVENFKYAKEVFAGGIIADLTFSSIISESSNHGKVSLVGEWENKYCYMEIGGLCGNCDDIMVSTNSVIDCYNTGEVSTDFTSDRIRIGGVCGESYETQCVYNVGEIVVPDGFKGLAGAVSGNIFHTSLAIGMPHYMTNAYYINEDMIPSYDWENLPENFNEEPFVNVKLLTEQEFKNQESFAGFDFESIWKMEEGGYPVLKNQPKVTVKENITLKAGQSYLLALGKKYHTSNADVAITGINGEIIAVASGTAVITVEYSDKYEREITVTVIDTEENNTPIQSEKPDILDFFSNLWIVKTVKQIVMFVIGMINSICTFIGF
ncbi:MAG: hypothetical protein IJZ07_06850 [Clostridia bacterium]|nr:hypothetical protein [Clostridia bacterium]